METLKDTQELDMNIFLSTKSKSSYEDFDNDSDDITLTGRVKYILNKLSYTLCYIQCGFNLQTLIREINLFVLILCGVKLKFEYLYIE